MKKQYELLYTEILGGKERQDTVILETDNITWSMEQFSRNRQIIKMDIKSIK